MKNNIVSRYNDIDLYYAIIFRENDTGITWGFENLFFI